MLLIKTNDDFTTSLERALEEIDPNWEKYSGTIVAGSHGHSRIPDKLEAIRRARLGGTPFLGICFGLQLAVVEYARNVLGLDADSTELNAETQHPVVVKLPALVVGMRNVHGRPESHWHNFCVNPRYLAALGRRTDKLGGFVFHEENGVVEEAYLEDHRYFMLTQYHPEYQSSTWNPHPVLKEFLAACKHGDTTVQI